MELHEVETLARTLMDEHGISDWTFAFDRATTRMGLCSWKNLRISVSRHYVEHADEVHVRDTLLHEIAHVLAGPAAKHGPYWKAAARRIGATPKACGTNPFVAATREERTRTLLASISTASSRRTVGERMRCSGTRPMYRSG
ncbi:SprT-like domain-containing protein [Microbacterium oleivorans]|uniref:SprT-like domain-containing protein n=1 Tax=Microbacterium TaxID=33882 RepID=UPI00340D27BC